jgi:hypothetical protein
MSTLYIIGTLLILTVRAFFPDANRHCLLLFVANRHCLLLFVVEVRQRRIARPWTRQV